MKYLLILALITISFVIGAFLGNRVGADSRAYYDAPGKLKILSTVLDHNQELDWIEGEVTTQVRILNEAEITPFKNAFFLKLTGNDIFISEYKKHLPIVKASQRYQEKLKFLCKYNEKYIGKCK